MASSTSSGSCGPPPAKKSKVGGSGHHKKEWEHPNFENGKYAGWIKASPDGPTHSFCVPCRKSIKVTASGIFDLKSHFATQGHKNCVAKSKTYRSMDEHFRPAASKPTISKSRATEAEVMFCQFVAEHNLAPSVADHFTDLVPRMFPDSQIAKEFSCKRTKTTMVIKDSLAPAYTLPVIEAMQKGPFSIMIDESNDKNTEKRLVILARLFDSKMSQTRFLDMPIPASGKAVDIFAEIDNFMRSHNIPWENVVGFASDNCNTMVGPENSVLSRPHVFSIGCICHLANLCVKAGVKALPMKLDDLLVDIFYFFQHSSKRLKDFKEFQEFTEVDEEKILKHCPTRWLSLEKVGNRTLSQLPALRSYFASHEDVEKPGKVKSINERLHDPITELVLCFMKYVLPIINKFNTVFQADESKIGSLLPEMDRLLRKLLVKFVRMSHVKAADNLRKLDLQNRSLQHSDELIAIGLDTREALQIHNLGPGKEKSFFEAVRGFYEAVVTKLLKKFPFDDPILPHLSVLDPKQTESLTYGPIVELAAAFCPTIDAEELKEEWEDLQLLPTDTVPPVNEEGKPIRVDTYWGQVMALNTALGVPHFPQLLKIYSALLCLPHSNADSERAFSMVRKIHTEFRKSMLPDTLTAFMQVKMNCDTPCFQVKPSQQLLDSAKAATWKYNKEHS